MTPFDHPDWPRLLPYLYIRHGADGVNGPRHRIEVSPAAPDQLLEMETACASCGRLIRNIRIDRRGARTFNASCPLEVNMRCARMPATTRLCAAVRAAMTPCAGSTQWGLF